MSFEIPKKEFIKKFHDIFFQTITEILTESEFVHDPYQELIDRLFEYSNDFSLQNIMTQLPDLLALAIRYGMEVEKAYQDQLDICEDEGDEDDQDLYDQKIIAKIKEDLDKAGLYL